jgi:hypothetical protein
MLAIGHRVLQGDSARHDVGIPSTDDDGAIVPALAQQLFFMKAAVASEIAESEYYQMPALPDTEAINFAGS